MLSKVLSAAVFGIDHFNDYIILKSNNLYIAKEAIYIIVRFKNDIIVEMGNYVYVDERLDEDSGDGDD